LTFPSRRFDFSGSRSLSYPNTKPSNHLSPTPAAKLRNFGKENGQPEMSSQVHVQQTISTSASHIYPGQVFYDPTFNPLYNHAFAHSFPYGGQQLNYNEDAKPPSRFASTFHGDFKQVRPNSRNSGPHGNSMNFDI
jgi:hypothetical protein